MTSFRAILVVASFLLVVSGVLAEDRAYTVLVNGISPPELEGVRWISELADFGRRCSLEGASRSSEFC
jgi:hypothetical protein